jgi:hypothetical protein
MQLYVGLALPNATLVKDCLSKCEKHYGAGDYRDCIGNARHYLEQVLEDVATGCSNLAGLAGKPTLVLPDRDQPPDRFARI